MEILKNVSNERLRFTTREYIRPIFHDIPWENNLTALLGTRGVGKTTLLFQRLKYLNLPVEEAMYIDLGNIYFQENRLIDFIIQFVSERGRYLFNKTSKQIGKAPNHFVVQDTNLTSSANTIPLWLFGLLY